MYELLFKSHFAAAHNLRGYQGDCERLHGHNWRVDVALTADRLDRMGMVVDFREVKALVDGLLKELDHHYLNELPAFEETNPTTENVAEWIFKHMATHLPDGVKVHKVTAWESDNCGASYAEQA
ncbi:MAG: 6-carboxytetrahydropterin synthase QueD [Planctomycetes bacterium]|jgi:6-pyruvoyltetrahydropterin/6-carboxytetrahydropterin synthase|nr:6-carboxytetrahydropterin synthase QueD [Planctomycetota bacterium]